MTGFDTVVVVDWSARAAPSPAKPSKDAIFLGIARDGLIATLYQRTRAAAMHAICDLIDEERRAGRRVLAAFDFPFGYPKGFAREIIGLDDPLALWAHLADRIEDDDRNGNSRFQTAAALNGVFPAEGPFWGHPVKLRVEGLPFRKPAYGPFPFSEKRRIEQMIPRAKPCFQLMGAGSVGSQALLGMARLNTLRRRYGDALSVAPFEAPDTPIVLAECYPGLIAKAVEQHTCSGEIPDRAQVRLLARAVSRLPPARLDELLREGDPVEGWILGYGAEAELSDTLP